MQLQHSPWPDGQTLDLAHGQKVCVWRSALRQLRPVGQLMALMPAGVTKSPAAAGLNTCCVIVVSPSSTSHTEAVSPALSGCKVEY